MIYADTDFFIALMKDSDWLQASARRLLKKYRGRLWISPAVLTELLLLAGRYGLDPEMLILDTLELAQLEGADPNVYLLAANYVRDDQVGVFDALHAAFCAAADATIISSDKIFDLLRLERIPLEPERSRADSS